MKQKDETKWDGYIILTKDINYEDAMFAKKMFESLGMILDDEKGVTGVTGYVYVYPDKGCAQRDIDRLRANGWDEAHTLFKIQKVCVKAAHVKAIFAKKKMKARK